MLLRVLTLIVVTPILFEITVRTQDFARFQMPFSSGVMGLEDLVVRDSLGYHARPGARFLQFKINALGFRGPEVSVKELRSKPAVIAMGASETFGLYESPNHEWPQQLAALLSSDCGDAPPLVLNAAVAGMSLPTVTQDLRYRLAPLRPLSVVYYPQPTQYLFEKAPKSLPLVTAPTQSPSAWRMRSILRVRSVVKEALPDFMLDAARAWRARGGRKGGELLFPQIPKDRLDSLESHLRILAGESKKSGTQLALIVPENRFADTTSSAEQRWLRGWESLVPSSPARVLIEFSELAKQRIRLVASDSSLPLIETAFPKDSTRATLFADQVHFSDEGARVVASATAKHLKTVLTCKASGPNN